MYSRRWSSFPRVGALFSILFISTLPAFSGNFSFTGSFTNDNDVQPFTFSLLSPGLVTLQTLGYGGSANNTGGTNALGQVILPGGFETMLSLFFADGTAVDGTYTPDPPAPACGLRTPDPARDNFCFDVYQQVSLAAGTYLLRLTQNPNSANGNLGAGFLFDSDPNFNNGFVGTIGFQGTPNWAVDILGVDQASIPGAVPEPAAVFLMAGSLLMLGLYLKVTRSSRSHS
jgi:hypothetical protein